MRPGRKIGSLPTTGVPPMSPIKILVAQGGGPTAVINQSLVGVVLEARRFPQVDARLRRAARRARHRRRGPGRPHAGDAAQPRAGGAHAGVGARLDARQAGPRLLRAHLRGAAGARHRLLLLHRRQRLVRHRAHRRRRGAQGRPPAALRPHPQDDRQRPRRQRPHARLPVGRPVRGAGLHGRQPRQRGAARRQDRRGHGPPRRLPHRRLGAGAHGSPTTART